MDLVDTPSASSSDYICKTFFFFFDILGNTYASSCQELDEMINTTRLH